MKKIIPPTTPSAGVVLHFSLLMFCVGLSQGQTQSQTNTPTDQAASSDYVCVQRGPDSKVWQRNLTFTNEDGSVTTNTQSYTEISTGISYLDVNGQYVDSVEKVDLAPGGAQAIQGRHKVFWTANANTPGGAVLVTTPDNKQLSSVIYGLAYYDIASGSNATIGLLKNCNGSVVEPNQVLYSDAFNNVTADILYSYTKAGLSQDIVFRQSPLPPDQYGLSDASTIIQIYTEFINPVQPELTSVTNGDAVDNQTIDFGEMQMGIGEALFLNGQDTPISAGNVQKQWVEVNNRYFLIESIPYTLISNQLQQLPHASNIKPGRGSLRRMALLDSQPSHVGTEAKSQLPMQLAKADMAGPRLVLDYVLSGSTSSFTLQGDTTYYVTGAYNVSGALTVEGGAVVKYTNSAAAKISTGSIICATGPYSPGIFTCMFDSSVGTSVTTSTNAPTRGPSTYLSFGTVKFSSPLLQNLRFSYASTALSEPGLVYSTGLYSNTIWDCQFFNCGTVFSTTVQYNSPNTFPLYVYNTLISKCANGLIATDGTGFGGMMPLNLVNVTADQTGNFMSEDTGTGSAVNCIFTAVTNNGLSQSHCCSKLSNAGIYQTVGAGGYYLTNSSTNRDDGTSSINSVLLSELHTLTTYPPVVYSNAITTNLTLTPQPIRDTNTPDLGYHYFTVDYAMNNQVSNATVTVSNGAILAGYGSNYGVWLEDNAVFNSIGSPTVPNYFVRYNTVQEQSNTNWASTNWEALLVTPPQSDSSSAYFDFTDWSVLATDNHVLGLGYQCPVGMQDCQLYNGGIAGSGPSLSVTNCLLRRVATTISDRTNNLSATFYNNLFYVGALTVTHTNTGIFTFRDNLFNQTTNTLTGTINFCSNNAYVTTNFGVLSPTNGDTFLSSVPTYQTGALGIYYYPTNLSLIHTGSRLATNAGLYAYTVTTNNAIEWTNTVSIGFHYAVVQTNGLPDWWQMEYFGTLNVNPNANPQGDGINNIDKYVLGLNPNLPYVSQLLIEPPGGDYVSMPSLSIFSLAGSSIKYTTNGTTPSATNGFTTASGVPLTNVPTGNFTLQAWESGLVSNVPVSATYTIIPASPVFSLTEGTYSSGTTLQISCATTNAVVRYTINGVDPTTNSTQIFATNILTLTTNVTMKATAWFNGYVSPEAQVSYIVEALPVGVPANDNFSNAITLSGASGTVSGTTYNATVESFETNYLDTSYDEFASEYGASVWYKWVATSTGTVYFDLFTSGVALGAWAFPPGSGTNPTNLVPVGLNYGYLSNPYADGIGYNTMSVTNGSTYYISASLWPGILAFNFTWQYVGPIAEPFFRPDSNTNLTAELVTVLDNDTNAIIHYTLDGSTPTTNSPVILSGNTLLITNTTTVKAAAWRVALSESAVKSALYTINASAPHPTQTASAPTISPTNQAFATSIVVTLSCTNAGAVIYYTLDGTIPSTASSSVASGGTATLTKSAIVNATTWVTNMNFSPITTGLFPKNGANTAGDGIPDTGKFQIGANFLVADAGSVNDNPYAHGLDNMQVYENQSVLLADNYSTANDGLPDWWLVKYGYSVTTPTNALGANGQTLLSSYLVGLNPNNPSSRAGQSGPIDFHVVHGPTNSVAMVLDTVRPGIAAYFLYCTDADTNSPLYKQTLLEEFPANTAISIPGTQWGRFFQMTNLLPIGNWLFTLQAVNSNGVWSPTSSNTFGRNYGHFDDVLMPPESESWYQWVGSPVFVLGYTSNSVAVKEQQLVQMLRAESDIWSAISLQQGGSGVFPNGPMLYDYNVQPVTTETSWGTLTFQFDSTSGNYQPSALASYFTPICATSDVSVDCDTYYADYDPNTELAALQLTNDNSGNLYFFMPAGETFNPAGLEYLSVTYRIGSGTPVTLEPGQSNSISDVDFTFEAAVDTETPTFQTVNYYFDGRQYPIDLNEDGIYWLNDFTRSAVPSAGIVSDDGWILYGYYPVSTTNPVIVGQVGRAVNLQAWSQVLAVRPNGAVLTNQPCWIDQDFGQAYVCDPVTGDVPRTTATNYDGTFKINTSTAIPTGILSPSLNYSNVNIFSPVRGADFTPTQTGKVIVTTQPDQNGFYGEVTIYVIDMQVDANHDGVMDNRDLTSLANPMQFWVNNDIDRGHVVDSTDWEQDDLNTDDPSLTSATDVPDCSFFDPSTGIYAIPSTRDLEDYARLWIPGFTNLMANLPTNYTVALKWRNETGAAIRLYTADETAGSTNYLFNSVIAAAQTNYYVNPCYGDVTPNQSLNVGGEYRLFAGTFTTSDHFIFCGTNSGNDELVLQVRNPWGGVMGEASVFLNLKDIKQMYERWTVGDDPGAAPTSIAIPAYDGLPSGVGSFQYPYDSQTDINTPYILHVHGSNMELWEKDRFAETMFKRLYWQGYQGRFGSFRWPTSWGNNQAYVLTHPYAFDQIEYAAWQSALGLKNMLTRLDILYPGQVELTAHSMGNITAGEALRQATNTLVDVYAAFQGSGAAHCYDTNATTISLGVSDAGESNVYAHFWTATNNQYFAGALGAANYVNFFNTNDFVLNYWLDDQLIKPQVLLGYSYHSIGNYYQGDSGVLSFPANTYEIFAFCQQARCNCIGEQGNLGGQFTSLGIPQQVNVLATPYSFGIAHKGHSAEFRSDNMSRAVFWNQVLIEMNLE